MPKAAKRSTRVARRPCAQSKTPTRCQVAAIAPQIEGIWREHDRIDALGRGQGGCEPHQQQLMSRLFEASEALKDVASFKRASSIEGALFQISLAYDCLHDLEMNKFDEAEMQEMLHRAKCLLFSAGAVIRLESKSDTGKRYMPTDSDPLVIFDIAQGVPSPYRKAA
jgi:hypothetical protein